MSYTALLIFKDGKLDEEIEYRNAWGGAARIWDALFKAHVPKKSEYDSWIHNGNDRRLWDLASDKSIPEFERAVHAFTFDRFYVTGKNFGRLADDLTKFVEAYPAGECVDHLPKWIEWLRNNKEEAVALYGTSVAENPWSRRKTCPTCENETDETETIPLSEGIEVYDWLKSLTKDGEK